jgi:hypothetical protein
LTFDSSQFSALLGRIHFIGGILHATMVSTRAQQRKLQVGPACVGEPAHVQSVSGHKSSIKAAKPQERALGAVSNQALTSCGLWVRCLAGAAGKAVQQQASSLSCIKAALLAWVAAAQQACSSAAGSLSRVYGGAPRSTAA